MYNLFKNEYNEMKQKKDIEQDILDKLEKNNNQLPVTLEQEVTAAILTFLSLYLSSNDAKSLRSTSPFGQALITRTSPVVSIQEV